MFVQGRSNHYKCIPKKITALWLAELLKEAGSKTEGKIESIIVTQDTTHHHSRMVYLDIKYSDNTEGMFPAQWIMKIRENFEGVAEGRFYELSERTSRSGLLPESGFFKQWASGESVLLVENLKSGYQLAVTSDQVFSLKEWNPHPTVFNSILQALAIFHAHWWRAEELIRHPDIFSQGGWWGRNSDFLNDIETNPKSNWSNAISAFRYGVELKPRHNDLITQAIETRDKIKTRLNTHPVTCAHGDCYPWHFFLSRTHTAVKLFDFEFVGINSPAHDLVSLLSYWQGDYREAFRLYHKALIENGVANYDFNELLDDVQLLIMAHSLMCVQDWRRGCSKNLWLGKLNGLIRMYETI